MPLVTCALCQPPAAGFRLCLPCCPPDPNPSERLSASSTILMALSAPSCTSFRFPQPRANPGRLGLPALLLPLCGRDSPAEDKLMSLLENRCMYHSKWEQLKKKKKKKHKIHWGPRCHRNWYYSLLPIINGGLCYYGLLETPLSPVLHCSMWQPPHS